MKLTQGQEKKIRKHCEAIPGSSGWWNQDGVEKFTEVAIKMVQCGFSVDDAIELLNDLFDSAAAEFGG